MKRHVVILGAGFAGLELACRLSETLADAVNVTLLDRNDSFYFGFPKLEVMLGRQSADAVKLPYGRTRFPDAYALGDVCTGPRAVPKAGIFAEAAARVVADDIAAKVVGGDPPAPYEASGVCYAEFGGGPVRKVNVNFLRGDSATAARHEPSLEHAVEKAQFGATRQARWFG